MWEICSPIQVFFFAIIQRAPLLLLTQSYLSSSIQEKKDPPVFSQLLSLNGMELDDHMTSREKEPAPPVLGFSLLYGTALSMLAARRHTTFGEGVLLSTSLPPLLSFFLTCSLSLYFAVTTMNMKAPPSGHYSLCRLLTHSLIQRQKKKKNLSKW